MKDLEIHLCNQSEDLADMGAALGEAGVSIEGGGTWMIGGECVAHFLVQDETGAEQALRAAGIPVLASREVVQLCLNQEVPGQLGLLARKMAEVGVNIEVLYSDHNNQLVLVVDDIGTARYVTDDWEKH